MKIKRLIVFVVIIVLYVFLINFFSVFFASEISSGIIQDNQASGMLDVKIGASVGVSVVKNRFYGRINEYSTEHIKVSYLYLFYFIKLPLLIHETNFLYFHIIFILLMIMIYLILKVCERRNKNETNLENIDKLEYVNNHTC